MASFFGRLLTKLATDWAATVQFRHPNEVGGSYFLFSIFLTVLMGLVSAFFYDHSEAEKSSPEGCSWKGTGGGANDDNEERSDEGGVALASRN